MTKLKTSISWGPIVGVWALFYTIIEALTLMIVEIMYPESEIDIARNFSSETYNTSPQLFGDHEFYVNNKDIRQKSKKNLQINTKFENLKEKEKPIKRVHEIKLFEQTNRFTTVRPTLNLKT